MADIEPSAKKRCSRAGAPSGTIVLSAPEQGRKRKTLEERSSDANVLFEKIKGVVIGLKASNAVMTDDQIMEIVKGQIVGSVEEVRDVLHNYLLDSEIIRNKKIEDRRTELRQLRAAAKLTADQQGLSASFKHFDTAKVEQMKKYLIIAFKELEFVALTSEKATPVLAVERLYGLAMGDLYTKRNKANSTLDSQVGDDEDPFNGVVYDDEDGDIPEAQVVYPR
jgi:hypothetical protein